VPAVHDATDTRPRHAWGAAADDLPSIRGVSLPKDLDRMTGPQLYDAYCATCHQAQAQRTFDGGLPPRFHNAANGGANTDNLVLVMLQGIHRETEPPEIPMPGFAKLSDRELATLGAYVVRRYGNPAAIVTVEQVATLRGGGAPSRLVLLVQVAMAVGILAIAAAIVFLARRRRAGA
jgi:mono/diheme cytochrome c family protein